MATTSRTSFVIATRDRSDELCGVLRRLLDTTDSPVIVVDNASRDDSVAAAQRVAAAAAGRVVVVALDRNEGAVARNIGVARAGTPYVAFCDDDSWWEPGAVAALANSPLGHDPALPGPSVLGFQACAALVRKSAFVAVGGFSPILHFRGEEGLLAWDLAAAGWDLCFCDALVAHHQPSTVRSPSRAQHARVLRNDALSAYLRRPVDRCARATVTLARAAVRDAAYGRALLEAAAALPAALRERRRLPDEVERSVRMLENA